MPQEQKPPRLDKSSSGVWYVKYSADGRSQRASLRTEDIQIAQERFQGWLKEHAADKVAAVHTTVAGAFRLYIEQHGKDVESPETLEHVSKALSVWFGGRHLSDITRLDIERYTRARIKGVDFDPPKRPVKPGTVRKELAIFRAVFNFMALRVEPKTSRIDKAQLCYIPLPPKAEPRNRVLSETELALIRRECAPPADGSRMDRISRYLLLLIETGARSEAIRSLTWDQIDLKAGIIRLNPWGRNQTTKRRPIIPISDDLMPILVLAHSQATTTWVLDHSGQIRKTMERFCERHRLEAVTAHTFRHTLATRLAEAGVDMRDIAAMLGDSMATVEKNYLHLSPGYLRGALDKIKSK